MCKKPRSRAKRVTWLRRFINVLQTRFDGDFPEAWFYGRRVRHFTPEAQRKACAEKLAKAKQELEALAP